MSRSHAMYRCGEPAAFTGQPCRNSVLRGEKCRIHRAGTDPAPIRNGKRAVIAMNEEQRALFLDWMLEEFAPDVQGWATKAQLERRLVGVRL